MTRDEFIKRAKTIKEDWLDASFDENLERVLDSELIDLDNIPEHYGPVYPVVAAILEKCYNACIYGGSDSRIPKRKANKILRTVTLK